MSVEDWKKLDRKVVGTIRQWVDDTVFHHVLYEISTRFFWKKLEDLYERKTTGNKTFLIQKLVNLKFKEGESIAEHLNQIQKYCESACYHEDEWMNFKRFSYLAIYWKV